MNAWFTDNFWNENVARKSWVSCFGFGFFSTIFCRFGVLEHVEGQTFVLVQDLVDQELVILCGVAEIEDLRGVVINVCFIVIALLNRLLWSNELADVDRCGTCEILEVVCKVLELILQVFRLLDGRLELLLLLFLRASLLLLGFIVLSLFGEGNLVRLLVLTDLHRLLLLRECSFFHL